MTTQIWFKKAIQCAKTNGTEENFPHYAERRASHGDWNPPFTPTRNLMTKDKRRCHFQTAAGCRAHPGRFSFTLRKRQKCSKAPALVGPELHKWQNAVEMYTAAGRPPGHGQPGLGGGGGGVPWWFRFTQAPPASAAGSGPPGAGPAGSTPRAPSRWPRTSPPPACPRRGPRQGEAGEREGAAVWEVLVEGGRSPAHLGTARGKILSVPNESKENFDQEKQPRKCGKGWGLVRPPHPLGWGWGDPHPPIGFAGFP